MIQKTKDPIKTLPWGEEVFLEVSLNGKSSNKFYARHAKNQGREFIEFTKFGPKPNAEGETYVQKMRLFKPEQWLQIRDLMEKDLISSIGWDLPAAEKALEAKILEASKNK